MHPSSGAGSAEESSDDTKTLCQQLTHRSADSEFVILDTGRARAQNSSESQNFGVIKKSTLPKCSAQRNRLGAFPRSIESYDPKDGAGKRSSQTNSWLARLATRSKLSTFVTAGVTRKASRARMMNSSSNGVILPSILQTHLTHLRTTIGEKNEKPKKKVRPSSATAWRGAKNECFGFT